MRTGDDVETIQIEVCSVSVYEFDYTPVDTYHRRFLHACVRLDTDMTVRGVFFTRRDISTLSRAWLFDGFGDCQEVAYVSRRQKSVNFFAQTGSIRRKVENIN